MKYTYRDLLIRLYDLKSLAIPPNAEEYCGNDGPRPRQCRYNEETGMYEHWGEKALLPGTTNFLYMDGEGNRIVMDVDGPGVIWRCWSGNGLNDKSAIKMWFDGEEKPSVDMTLLDFFCKHGDDVGNMNFPNLVTAEQSRGAVFWMPIPFQKHIKIAASVFFNYSLFPKDTILPNFADRYSRENCIAKAETDRILGSRGRYNRHNFPWIERKITLRPNETSILYERAGSGAINGFRYFPEIPEGQDEGEFLRWITLSISWDGRKKPAVWAPIGDFFGSALKIGYFRTLPLGMNDTDSYCNWYMPFSEGVQIKICNQTDRVQTLRFVLNVDEVPKTETESQLRFHAKWHPTDFKYLNAAEFESGQHRWPDWPVLLCPGVYGRYCGVNLHVYNDLYYDSTMAKSWWVGRWNPYTEETPNPYWFWGEGREKFFVDGEKFPSTFGNGTEDYAGYSFSAEPPFPLWDMPFASVTNIPLTGIGHIAQLVCHIADNIPFHNGFEGFIEKFKPDEWSNGYTHLSDGPNNNRTYYAVTPFWYQQAGTDDLYDTYPKDKLFGFYHLPPLE